MSAMRDPDVVLSAWLDEGPTHLPESTRRAIATSTRTIHQRRRGFGRPWRDIPMHALMRPALVAGAVVILIGGIYLARPSGPGLVPGVVGPQGSPTPSPAVSDTPAPLVGRIGFTRFDTEMGPFGPNLGTFIADADGTNERELDLPFAADGIVFSPDGTQILLPNSMRPGQNFRPAIANADGSAYRVLEVEGDFSDMWCGAWSPDAAWILCSIADGDDPSVDGIYRVAVDTLELDRLTSDSFVGVVGTEGECGGGDVPGDFSPDGRRFVFVREICGTGPDPSAGQVAELHVGTVDGSTEPIRITNAGLVNPHQASAHWSPDGSLIVFATPAGMLYTVTPDGSEKRAIAVEGSPGGFMYSPEWSPDGDRIVFSMWKAGSSDLYSIASDGSDFRRVTDAIGSEDFTTWAPPQ